jgi:hypothetical protein
MSNAKETANAGEPENSWYVYCFANEAATPGMPYVSNAGTVEYVDVEDDTKIGAYVLLPPPYAGLPSRAMQHVLGMLYVAMNALMTACFTGTT